MVGARGALAALRAWARRPVDAPRGKRAVPARRAVVPLRLDRGGPQLRARRRGGRPDAPRRLVRHGPRARLEQLDDPARLVEAGAGADAVLLDRLDLVAGVD